MEVIFIKRLSIKICVSALLCMNSFCLYLVHCLAEVQGVYKPDKVVPLPSSLSVVRGPGIATPADPSIVEVVGRVGGVHNPGKILGKQSWIALLPVVLLPVYTKSKR